MNTQMIEWDGKEYEVKYTFKFIQRLKNNGINIAAIYNRITNDLDTAGLYLDDYVNVAFECLKFAGAPVTAEQLWAGAKQSPEFAAACAELFMWLVSEHYAVSENAPKPKN